MRITMNATRKSTELHNSIELDRSITLEFNSEN